MPESLDGPDPVVEPYEPPAAGRPIDELLGRIREGVLDRAMNPAHPGYLGHLDTIASAIGIFADAVVSACNNNMLSYEMSLVFTRMEQAVLRWAARRFGLGERAGGCLVSGGSLANVQALWTARNARLTGDPARTGLAGANRRPVVIASDQVHYSVFKAANLLGLGRDGLLRVPAGADGRVDPGRVEERILAAREEGCEPFCLVGIAGTTVTGTVEPLVELGAIARRHGLWFHVDAAYGGSLILSPTLAPLLRGIEAADSITWNPQKWLFVPKACASILYRDTSVMERTIRERFVYGRDNGGDEGPNLGEYTIQGTRRVDVLKLWLTLEHLGTGRLGELIDRNVERAARLARGVEESEGLELVVKPDLNLVCFRARPREIGAEEGERLDALQVSIQREVARKAGFWLSLPRHRGRRILRAVVLHPDAGEESLDALLEALRTAASRRRL